MPIKKVEIMPTGAEPRIIPSEPTRIDRTTPGSGGTPLTNSEPQEVNIGDPLADCEKQLMAVVYSAEPILENVRRIVEGFLKPGGKSRSDGEAGQELGEERALLDRPDRTVVGCAR